MKPITLCCHQSNLNPSVFFHDSVSYATYNSDPSTFNITLVVSIYIIQSKKLCARKPFMYSKSMRIEERCCIHCCIRLMLSLARRIGCVNSTSPFACICPRVAMALLPCDADERLCSRPSALGDASHACPVSR
jgi:hypothetical protein